MRLYYTGNGSHRWQDRRNWASKPDGHGGRTGGHHPPTRDDTIVLIGKGDLDLRGCAYKGLELRGFDGRVWTDMHGILDLRDQRLPRWLRLRRMVKPRVPRAVAVALAQRKLEWPAAVRLGLAVLVVNATCLLLPLLGGGVTAYFWVGGSGTFNDSEHWATSSGGAGGAGVPGSTDSATFDANSGAAATITNDAVTNLCTNGGLETNTTGWATNVGSETISRDATVSKFGAASLKVITPGGVREEGALFLVTGLSSGPTYTASAWVNVPLGVAMEFRLGNTTPVAKTYFTGTGGWQRVSATFVSTNTQKSIEINTSDAVPGVAITFWVDGVQFETGSTAHGYVETNGGTATFSGANVASIVVNKSDLTLLDNAGLTASSFITFLSGTFNTNGQAQTWGSFSSTGSGTRTLTLGASSITITASFGGGGGQALACFGTNLTLTANTATVTSTGANTSHSYRAGDPWNNLVFTGAGFALVNGNPTCANLTRTGTATLTDQFIVDTISVTVTGTLTLSGNSPSNRLFVNTTSPGGPARTITASAVSLANVDFMDIIGNGFGSTNTLTLGGGEITDATRRTNTQGDGLVAPSGFGLWPAATNLCTNGGFESNTTQWAAKSAATLTRDTTAPKFGTASLKVVTPGSVNGEGASYSTPSPANDIVFAIGDVYTASAWVNAPVGATLHLQLDEAGAFGMAGVNFTGTGTWQRVSVSGVVGATMGHTGPLGIQIYTNGTQAITYWVDGVQGEKGNTNGAIATPYIETNGSTASRSNSGITVPASSINGNQGWYAVRFKPGWDSTFHTSLPADPWLFDWNDGTNRIRCYYNGSFNCSRFAGGSGSTVSVASAFSAGDVLTIVFAWDASNVKVSVNGAAFTSLANAGSATIANSGFTISPAGTHIVDGNILWAAIGTGTLSDANAATINGFGSTAPLKSSAPGAATFVWNASPASSSIGDCQGNTDIVCDASISQVYPGGTANWTAAAWATRVPLPQDDVTFPAAGTGTLTVEDGGSVERRLCRTINFTGWAGTFKPPTSTQPTLAIYGSLTFPASGPTWSTSPNFGLSFRGRGAFNIDTNGKSLNIGNSCSIYAYGGSYTLLSDLDITVAGAGAPRLLAVNAGTLFCNGKTVQAQSASGSSSGTIDLAGATTIKLSGSGGAETIWDFPHVANAGSSTILLRDSLTGGQQTFQCEGQSFGTLKQTTASGGNTLNIQGNGTFVNLDLECTSARTVKLQAGATQTVAGALTLTGPLTIQSDAPGTSTTINASTAFDATISGTSPSADIIITAPKVIVTNTSAAAAGQVWTGSARLKITANPNSVPVGVTVLFRDSNGVALQKTSSTLTVSNDFETQTAATATAPASTSTVELQVRGVYTNAQTATVLVDGAQLELKPLPTPYVHTDGGSASRSAARVQAPPTLLNTSQGWVAMRLRMGFASSAPPTQDTTLFELEQSPGTNGIDATYIGGSFTARNWNSSPHNHTDVAVARSFAAGTKITVIVAWTTTAIRISIDGATFVSQAHAHVLAAATSLDFGSFVGSGFFLDGDILWAATGTGVLSDGDASTINGFGDADPDISQFPSGGATTAVFPFRTSHYDVSAPVAFDTTKRDQWQRLSGKFIAPDTSLVYALRSGDAIPGLETMYVDGVQVEAKAIPTPYVETNGGTATRSAARVQAPANLLDKTQGWVAIRARMGFGSATQPNNAFPFDWYTSNNDRMQLFWNASAARWETRRRNSATTGGDAFVGDAFVAGDKRTLVIRWDATTIAVSVNGAAFVVASNSHVSTLLPALFDLGTDGGAGIEMFDSDILWAACGIGTLSDADASTLNGFGDTDPDLSQFPGAAVTTAVFPFRTGLYDISTPAALDTTKRDRWQRKTVTFVAPDTALTYALRSGDAIPGLEQVYLDGVQVEAKQFATPYVETNGGTASRGVARMQAPASLLNAQQGWFAARVRVGFAYNASLGGAQADLFCWGSAAQHLELMYDQASAKWQMFRGPYGGGHADSAAQTFSPGDVLTIIGKWDGSNAYISVNGGNFVSNAVTAYSAPPADSLFDIGTGEGATPFDGDVIWAACGTGVLSNADAATLNGFGNTDPDMSDFPGTALATAVFQMRTGHYDISSPVAFDTSKRDQWQRQSVTFVAPGTAHTFALRAGDAIAGLEQLYLDGVQVEQKAVRTPYVETNGGTAARGAARVQAPGSLLEAVQGWFAVRVKMGFPSTQFSADNRARLLNVTDGTQSITLDAAPGPTCWEAKQKGPTGAAVDLKINASWVRGDEFLVIVAWDTTKLYLSVNGSAYSSVALNSDWSGELPALIDIGSNGAADSWFDGNVIWSACGKGVLSPADIATLLGYGDVPPRYRDLPGDALMLWRAVDSFYFTAEADPLAGFATIFPLYAPPSNESETYFGRLPWPSAEDKLNETGPMPIVYRAAATWHGTILDKEVGAFALVNADGPLAALIGERLRITVTDQPKQRTVIVYCNGTTKQITDDLSLTRRAFGAIAPLSSTSISVRVEVLS